MTAMVIAQKTLSEGHDTKSFLSSLLEKGHLDEETISIILKDEELKHFFTEKDTVKTKKPSLKKTSGSKKASSSSERNTEVYDTCRCCARLWKPVDNNGNPCKSGKYGLDNVQCLAVKFPDSDWCEKHQAIHDAMKPIGGYWLGKVNEARPKEIMLPKGSLKKGYDCETLIPHYWRFDENGEIISSKGTSSNKFKEAKDLEKKVEKKKKLVKKYKEKMNSKKEKEEQAEFEEWKEMKKQEKVKS